MGRGNICVHGNFEGLYYIPYEFVNTYTNKQNGRTELEAELSYEELTNGNWEFMQEETQREYDNLIDNLTADFKEMFPKFKSCNEWLGQECKAILESKLFYIALEDNEWSMTVELLQKEDPYDNHLEGLQKRHYETYLNGLLKILMRYLDEVGTYNGPWTSGRIKKADYEELQKGAA